MTRSYWNSSACERAWWRGLCVSDLNAIAGSHFWNTFSLSWWESRRHSISGSGSDVVLKVSKWFLCFVTSVQPNRTKKELILSLRVLERCVESWSCKITPTNQLHQSSNLCATGMTTDLNTTDFSVGNSTGSGVSSCLGNVLWKGNALKAELVNKGRGLKQFYEDRVTSHSSLREPSR